MIGAPVSLGVAELSARAWGYVTDWGGLEMIVSPTELTCYGYNGCEGHDLGERGSLLLRIRVGEKVMRGKCRECEQPFVRSVVVK